MEYASDAVIARPVGLKAAKVNSRRVRRAAHDVTTTVSVSGVRRRPADAPGDRTAAACSTASRLQSKCFAGRQRASAQHGATPPPLSVGTLRGDC